MKVDPTKYYVVYSDGGGGPRGRSSLDLYFGQAFNSAEEAEERRLDASRNRYKGDDDELDPMRDCYVIRGDELIQRGIKVISRLLSITSRLSETSAASRSNPYDLYDDADPKAIAQATKAIDKGLVKIAAEAIRSLDKLADQYSDLGASDDTLEMRTKLAKLVKDKRF